MNLPGFTGNSSIYRSAAAYRSAGTWGDKYGPNVILAHFAPGGGALSDSSVRPAQSSSNCGPNCLEPCFFGCLASPFWTWGTCFNNCNIACTCPFPEVCENGSCVCAPPFTECSGVCTSLADDSNNCGECGKTCPAGDFCAPAPVTGIPTCYPIT
jgi:hypothetical protein